MGFIVEQIYLMGNFTNIMKSQTVKELKRLFAQEYTIMKQPSGDIIFSLNLLTLQAKLESFNLKIIFMVMKLVF